MHDEGGSELTLMVSNEVETKLEAVNLVRTVRAVNI